MPRWPKTRGVSPSLRSSVILVATMVGAGVFSTDRAQTVSRRISAAFSHRGQRPLFKDSRADLALALVSGKKEISILLAAVPGRNEAMAATVRRLGGSVAYRDDEVSYVRAVVPLGKVQELAGDDNVESAAVDANTNRPAMAYSAPDALQGAASEPDRRRSEGTPAGNSGEWPPKLSDYPIRKPYSPLKDMDASAFLKEHPTFDGRGTTIAIIDNGFIDLTAPEFQWATTMDGKAARKVINCVNPSDPDFDRGPEWVSMEDRVTTIERRLTYKGQTFTVPKDGTYRIGFLDERKFVPPYSYWLNGDLNRDGNPEGSSGLFGVLWNEISNEVWVDTNQNRDFSDEKPMKDYAVRFDVGAFGSTRGSTAGTGSVSFTIQTDLRRKLVSVNVGASPHATLVAGAAAGSMSQGGRYNGVAPGSQLVLIGTNTQKTSTYIEGLIAAFRDPRVDVIVYEQYGTTTSPYVLKDGNFITSVIRNRLIEKYKKPVFVPASNPPGLNRISEDAVSRLAISVGAYQSRENYMANNALVVANEDNLHFAGSYGPGGDGSLNPWVLSPASVLSSWPAFIEAIRVKGLYRLPAGYVVAGGTSTAAPVAAGAVALLISGAKQRRLSYDAERIRYAIGYSARYIPHIQAHKQGNGLIQVEAAWNVLNALQGRGWKVSMISRAPVRTAVSEWFRTSNEGVGIYEREGWAAGDRGERDITFTRFSGSAEPVMCRVIWLGNDGTFSSAGNITLPLNSAVRLPVKISAESPGVHSAILTLEDTAEHRTLYRVMNTVVAAEQYDSGGQAPIEHTTSVERPGTASFYFNMPTGVGAFKVDLVKSDGSINRWVYPPNSNQEPVGASLKDNVAVANPDPGVWEVALNSIQDLFQYDPERRAPFGPTPVRLSTSVLGTEITPLLPAGGAAKAGATHNVSFKVKNKFAAFTGAVKSRALGSAHDVRARIAHNEEEVYEINVLPGSELLMVQIGQPSDEKADLDLYLFNCTGDTPVAERKRIGPSANEVVFVERPVAGLWKVVVDAFSVPSGSTTYEYLDVFTNPQFGSVSVTDIERYHASGEEWTATANVWIADAPGAGRVPCGLLFVSSDAVKDALQETVPLGLGRIMFEQWHVQ